MDISRSLLSNWTAPFINGQFGQMGTMIQIIVKPQHMAKRTLIPKDRTTAMIPGHPRRKPGVTCYLQTSCVVIANCPILHNLSLMFSQEGELLSILMLWILVQSPPSLPTNFQEFSRSSMIRTLMINHYVCVLHHFMKYWIIILWRQVLFFIVRLQSSAPGTLDVQSTDKQLP